MAQNNTKQWQVGKSLIECNRYRFKKQIDCDVWFKITSPKVIRIGAHKLMLMTRSPVFEAMFSGNFPQTTEVPITDIEAIVFTEMLRYIYTDEAKLCANNVIHLLAAAKKYILEGLAEMCTNFLEIVLDIDNVCTLLDQSNFFEVDQLQDKCLQLITAQMASVMKTDGFVKLSQNSMLQILKQDKLEIAKETDVYHACVAWAKHNAVKGQQATDAELRQVLGPCLHNIRFGSMSPSEFANTGAKSDILSPEEKSDFFCFIVNQDKKHQLKTVGFNLCARLTQSICHIYKHVQVIQGEVFDCFYNHSEETLEFSVDRDINLTGFTVLSCKESQYYDLRLTINIIFNGWHDEYVEPDEITEVKQITPKGKSPHLALSLDANRFLKAGHTCIVTVVDQNGIIPNFEASTPKSIVRVQDVTFHFPQFDFPLGPYDCNMLCECGPRSYITGISFKKA